MIEEAYVSYETARLLKEKGFDGTCYACYEYFSSDVTMYSGWPFEYKGEVVQNSKDRVKCPTQQMVLKWLREKHYIAIVIDCWFGGIRYISWHGKIMCYGDNLKTQQDVDMPYVATYEEAVEEAIKYCLENFDLNEY